MQRTSVYLAWVILKSSQHKWWDVVLQRGAEVRAAGLSGCHQLRVVTHSLQLHQDLKHADKMTCLQRLLSSRGAQTWLWTVKKKKKEATNIMYLSPWFIYKSSDLQYNVWILFLACLQALVVVKPKSSIVRSNITLSARENLTLISQYNYACGANISPWLSEDIFVKALLSGGETAL